MQLLFPVQGDDELHSVERGATQSHRVIGMGGAELSLNHNQLHCLNSVELQLQLLEIPLTLK